MSGLDGGRSTCRVCNAGSDDAVFLCDKHRLRDKRYGSPTAMRCVTCKTVVDDRETASLDTGKRWQCSGCAPKYCENDQCSNKVPPEHAHGRHAWRYCSPKCRERAANARRAVLVAIRRWGTPEPGPVPCLQCSEEFVPKKTVRGRQLYCSKACLHLAGREQLREQGLWERKIAYKPRRREGVVVEAVEARHAG